MKSLWAVTTLLIILPATYFGLAWVDYNYRIGAMENWFGTMMGVIAGVPVALSLARAQQTRQLAADSAKQSEARNQQLYAITHRVYSELEHDKMLIDALAKIPCRFPSPNPDIWKWAEAIAGGIEFDGNKELSRTLVPEELASYGSVLLAYTDLHRLARRVRECGAAFPIIFQENPNEANDHLTEIATRVSIVKSEIETALNALSRLLKFQTKQVTSGMF